MILNSKQVDYLLDHWFIGEDGEVDELQIYKVFDTTNRDWLKKQKIEVEPYINNWYQVLMNGDEITTINCDSSWGHEGYLELCDLMTED